MYAWFNVTPPNMTHEDLAVQNILATLSEEEQSNVRIAAMKKGVTLAEFFALAVKAGTERILDAESRRQAASSTTALLA